MHLSSKLLFLPQRNRYLEASFHVFHRRPHAAAFPSHHHHHHNQQHDYLMIQFNELYDFIVLDGFDNAPAPRQRLDVWLAKLK